MNELPRTLEGLLRAIKLNGWTIDYSNRGHLKIYNTQGSWVTTTSGTGSDYRGVRNFRAALKRGGLKAVPDTAERQRKFDPKETEVIELRTLPAAPEEGSGNPSPPPAKAEKPKYKEVILEAAQTHPGGEFSIAEIYEQVHPILSITREALGTKLHGYAQSGHLERIGFGRYRVRAAGLLPPVPIEPAPAPSVEESTEEDDIRVLDEFLSSMARVEKVIRKHIKVKSELRQLRALLNSLGK